MHDRLRRRIRRGRGARRPAAAPPSDLSRLLERLNPATLAQATGHRVILHRHLTALGLPVPRLHGVIGSGGGWSASRDRPVLGAEAAGRFLAGLPGDVVVRPFAASRGVATRVLRREGPVFIDLGGEPRTPAEVADEAWSDPGCALFLVQERVVPHERVRALAPQGRLATARITTFVADDGRAQVVHACLMVPASGAGPGRVVEEPDGGERLPGWDAARALACRGAELLMPQRSFAWDMALTPEGPVILAADSRYSRVASARFDGALRAMERAVAGGEPVAPGGAG